MYFCSSFTLPYEMDSLAQALTICKFYMLSIKFSYAAAFYSMKTSLKLVPSAGELVWPFGNFLFVFCAFGCLTFLPFVRETFLILWNVRRGFCFATSFHCCLLILHSVFCIVFHSWSFHPHYCHVQSHCVYLKVYSSGWLFSPAFIPPEVFFIPDLSNSVAHLNLLHISL